MACSVCYHSRSKLLVCMPELVCAPTNACLKDKGRLASMAQMPHEGTLGSR